MENKKLVIAFIWTFIIAVLVIESAGAGLSFVGYMALFFVALGSTIAVEFILPDKQQGIELQEIKLEE